MRKTPTTSGTHFTGEYDRNGNKMKRWQPSSPAIGPTKEQLAEKQARRETSQRRVSMDEAAQELFWVSNMYSTSDIIKELKTRGLIPEIFFDKLGNVTPEAYNRINEMKIGKREDRRYLSILDDIVLTGSVSGMTAEQIIESVKRQIGFHKRLIGEDGKLSESGRKFIVSRMYKDNDKKTGRIDTTGHRHDDDGR